MRTSMANFTHLRKIFTTGTAALLLAVPVVAQDPAQGAQQQSLEDREETFRNAPVSGSVRKGPITKNLSAPEPEQESGSNSARDFSPSVRNGEDDAVITRSFKNESELSEARQVEAGSSVNDSNQNGGAPTRARQQNIAEVPEGTGVILKDGEVIAQTRREQTQTTEADEQENISRSEEPNSNSQPEDDARVSDQSQQANPTEQSPDRRGIYRYLEGTPVVNSQGESIGVVVDVAVNNQNDETALIISTGDTAAANSLKILAPVREVIISSSTVVWDTPRSRVELEQSERYASDNYNTVVRQESPTDDAPNEGVSQ